MVLNCNYKKGCPECNGKHNGLLHFREQEKKIYEKKFEKPMDKKKAFVAVAEDEAETESEILSCLVSKINDEAILATAQIRIKLAVGWSEPVRALIDQGSMASFITEKLVNDLKLSKQRNNVSVSGIAGTVTERSRGSVNLEFSSRFPTRSSLKTSAIVLGKLV